MILKKKCEIHYIKESLNIESTKITSMILIIYYLIFFLDLDKDKELKQSNIYINDHASI